MPKENPDWIDETMFWPGSCIAIGIRHSFTGPLRTAVVRSTQNGFLWGICRNIFHGYLGMFAGTCMYSINPKLNQYKRCFWDLLQESVVWLGNILSHSSKSSRWPHQDLTNGKPRFGRGNSSATIGSFMAKFRHLGSKWLPPMVGISNIALNISKFKCNVYMIIFM